MIMSRNDLSGIGFSGANSSTASSLRDCADLVLVRHRDRVKVRDWQEGAGEVEMKARASRIMIMYVAEVGSASQVSIRVLSRNL